MAGRQDVCRSRCRHWVVLETAGIVAVSCDCCDIDGCGCCNVDGCRPSTAVSDCRQRRRTCPAVSGSMADVLLACWRAPGRGVVAVDAAANSLAAGFVFTCSERGTGRLEQNVPDVLRRDGGGTTPVTWSLCRSGTS